MGTSILLGGLSTFLGTIPLFLSQSLVFRTMCKAFFSMVVLGVLHGLILLPALLSIFGADQSSRSFKLMCGVVKKSTNIDRFDDEVPSPTNSATSKTTSPTSSVTSKTTSPTNSVMSKRTGSPQADNSFDDHSVYYDASKDDDESVAMDARTVTLDTSDQRIRASLMHLKPAGEDDQASDEYELTLLSTV
jgi:hypothetical protein